MHSFSGPLLLLIFLILIAQAAAQEAPIHSTVCQGADKSETNLAELALTSNTVSATVFRIVDGKPEEAETVKYSSACDKSTLSYHVCNKNVPGSVETGHLICSNGCNQGLSACSVSKETDPQNLVCKKTDSGVEILTQSGQSLYKIENKAFGPEQVEFECGSGGLVTSKTGTTETIVGFFGFKEKEFAVQQQTDSLQGIFLIAIPILVVLLLVFAALCYKQKKIISRAKPKNAKHIKTRKSK